MPAAAGSSSGWRSTAIHAIPRSMRSIGLSASRSPRPATTSSVSWRTCRFIAFASAPALPDIPTFAEMGLPGLLWSAWVGLFAPRGTPTDIIGKLNAAAVEALADQAIRSRLVELGFEIFPREQQTPKALGALQKADAEKWWPIIKEFGIKGQ